MILYRLLGYPLERALAVLKEAGQPLPHIEYTLANIRREEETRAGMTPRVVGVRENNTFIVSYFRDSTPRVQGETKND